MKLVAYVPDGQMVEIRPAPLERAWMETTGERYAYRCLPLNIANAYGWEILCASGFSASWNGGSGIGAVKISADFGTAAPAASHFGNGVLTFHVPCLFRTDPGVDLMIQGPINRPKDGIAALSGVVETDWAPYTFTMNWIFTRPDVVVRFDRGEPFCQLFPLGRGQLEHVEPVFRSLSEEPDLKQQYQTWHTERARFNFDLKEPESDAAKSHWQKRYYRGLDAAGRPGGAIGHRTRVKAKPFAKSLAYAAGCQSPDEPT